MSEAALKALREAYLEQVAWMHARAEELESGKCQHHVMEGGRVRNKSQELAEEFRHRARNLQAAIDAYDRLSLKRPA
jgi:hypothetical protein